MGILVALFVGAFIGIVAKFLMPGKDPGGFFITTMIGIAGSMVANVIGHQMGNYGPGQVGGFLASVIGAMLLLTIYRLIAKPA